MFPTKQLFSLGIICAASLIFLSNCQRTPQYKVKEESITVTGMLTATGVSLIRRGTHVIVNDADISLFVESKNIDLQPYEGHKVTVSGMLKNNTSPSFLPVIVADNIQSLDGSSHKHEWRIPALKIIVKTPESWNGKLENNTLSFTLPNIPTSFLHMKLELKKLPKDTSLQNFTLHGHRGMSKRNETDGSQEMYLENGDYTLSILFDPSKVIVGNDDIAQKKMTKDFEQMLNDMIVLESKSSTSLTGSGTGIPCGGSAGILCPTGYFCDIVDLSTRIGHCTK